MPFDLNFMIGGEAGQGVQSAGYMLARALARGGLNVFADQDYESRIRGGHNFFRVRASDKEVSAISESVNVLVALNRESLDLHRSELASRGVAVYDGEKAGTLEKADNLFAVPLERLARQVAGKLMANTVSLGAALGVAGFELESMEEAVREQFGAGDIGEANVRAVRAGHEFARSNFNRDLGQRIAADGGERKMLLSGNEAIAIGALAAGCKFMAAYPMTPSTSIMEYMAAKSGELDVVVVQPEDEIAAVNMLIGASFAGLRSMTATSGSGFCLMVEGLSLAGMTETPVVIVDGQRPGPATGLPTRTEQSDLEFAVHAGHGDFPRAVLATATAEDCFWLTVKAFNLAEKYQLPVLLLTDQHLASSYATVRKFDLSKVVVERGQLIPRQDGLKPDQYRRHLITDSGVSPRALPQRTKALVATDADEHDEFGHLIEDAGTRTAMVSKRLRKLDQLRKEMGAPRLYGAPKADVTLLGWGSTYGALKETVDLATMKGASVNLVHMNEIWPFPGEAAVAALGSASRLWAVENNATGQLAHLLRAEAGRQVDGAILKFDGRPFSPAYIMSRLEREAF
jgi:2-oxoglutarate ferredoxin oxidoreductase subunit alpha